MALLGSVQGTIVDACYSRLMTRNVIEQRLDHVWLHAQLGHPGRSSTAQVVETPRTYLRAIILDPLVERGLGVAPALKRAASLTKDEVAVSLAGRVLEN